MCANKVGINNNNLKLLKVPTMCQKIPMLVCLAIIRSIDDYAKDGGPGEVRLFCSFYHESLRTWIKTIVNKFAISNYTAFRYTRTSGFDAYIKLW